MTKKSESDREIAELLASLKEQTEQNTPTAPEKATKKAKEMTDEDVKAMLRRYYSDVDTLPQEKEPAFEFDTSEFVEDTEPEVEEEPEIEEGPEVEEEPAEVEEAPAEPLVVLTAPVFEPLTVGYKRSEIPTAAAALTNNGEEPVVVRAARLSGRSSGCFALRAEKNVTVAPGETNDTAWVIAPKYDLPSREYTAELTLILDTGEKLSVPVSLTVVKP